MSTTASSKNNQLPKNVANARPVFIQYRTGVKTREKDKPNYVKSK